jgi:hypothetical protein
MTSYFLPLMAVAVVLYAAGLNGHWRFQRDSVLYMALGRSLAETGTYSFDYEPHVFVWPGFPAMLSVLYMAFGESFLAMNVLVKLFGLGCIAMAFALFGQLPLSWRQMLACFLLFGLSRTLYYYSSHVMADVPFTFFVVAGLYCGMRTLQTNGRTSWLWCMAASAATCGACFLRPLGPAVLIALVAGLWLRTGAAKRWAPNLGKTAVLVAPLAVLGAVWLLRCTEVNTPSHLGYYDVFIWRHGVVNAALHAVRRIPVAIGSLSDAVLGVDLPPAGVLLFLPMGAGLVTDWRRGERLLCVFGMVYLGGICLGSPGRRYLLPALPVLLYWLVVGAGWIGGYVASRWKSVPYRRIDRVAAALLLLALTVNVMRIGKVIYEQRSPDFYAATGDARLKSYFQLSEWLTGTAGPQDVVLAYEYRFLHYFSRVRTEPFPRGRPDWRARWVGKLSQNAGTTYLVRDLHKDPPATGIGNLLRAYPDAFAKACTFGTLDVFRVSPDKLRKDERWTTGAN